MMNCVKDRSKSNEKKKQRNRLFGSVARKGLALLLVAASLSGVACRTSHSKKPGDSVPSETKDAEASFSSKATSGQLIPSASEVPTPSWEGKDLFAASEKDSVCSIVIKAEENAGMLGAFTGSVDSDKQNIRLTLPGSMDVSRLVFYAKHDSGKESGPYLADFTDRKNKANKQFLSPYGKGSISVNVLKLPALMLTIDETHGTFQDVLDSRNHSVYAYGDMMLSVPEAMAQEKGWSNVYLSRNKTEDTPKSCSIRGRGNATWRDFDKRPFHLHTENNLNLLGMGSEKNWALLANALDASRLRNELFYNLAVDMGLEYSPECRSIDVFVDGKYLGIYLLTETVKFGRNRINIDRNQDFLYEIDHYFFGERYAFSTKMGTRITFHNPEAGFAEAKNTLEKIEQAIYDTESEDFLNYIDVDAFARYYLLQELSLNYDVLKGSGFMYYRQSDGKLHPGPVWDMDNTLAVYDTGPHMNTEGVYAGERSWFKPLLQQPAFVSAVVRVYYEEGVRELFAALPEKLQAYSVENRLSVLLDHTLYPVYRHPYSETNGASYGMDVSYVKRVLMARLRWIDSYLATLQG